MVIGGVEPITGKRKAGRYPAQVQHCLQECPGPFQSGVRSVAWSSMSQPILLVAEAAAPTTVLRGRAEEGQVAARTLNRPDRQRTFLIERPQGAHHEFGAVEYVVLHLVETPSKN